LPNAGKSTLLAAVSAAKPKIADYPFTTLHPQLGVVLVGTQSFVLADIPGLIEGAHEGHGLGTRFLGHVERCAVLLHLIDVSGDDPVQAYRVIRKELKAYSPELAEKPEVIAFNKTDLLQPDEVEAKLKDFKRRIRKTPILISGATTKGVPEAMKKLLEVIDTSRRGGRPGDEPGVLPDHIRSGSFNSRRQRHARGSLHRTHQRLPHPASGADDDQPHVAHGCGPSYPATITVSVEPASFRYLTAA